MRRERKEQAHGPYRRGRKWRVVETSATGARATCSFETEALALDYIAQFNDQAEGRTVSGVIDAYLAYQATQGLRPGSVTTLRYRLKGITRVVERDRLLSAVSPATAAELYAARVATVKPDTHRGELAAARGLFAWCVKRGWLQANPFAAVEPEGRKVTRKGHLRIDEARAYRDAALDDATDSGLAAALALLLGLRAGEVVGLRVRDVDDGARVLWIDGAKTDAGDRHLEVPEELRARLRRRIANRAPEERLFGEVDRHWLGYHVQRVGVLAKLTRKVTPHMLRRTWSAIGAETMPIDAVSRALGHAGVAITRRHYQPTNAEERRAGASALATLGSGNRRDLLRFPVAEAETPPTGNLSDSACAGGDSNSYGVTH
jgi:integrase